MVKKHFSLVLLIFILGIFITGCTSVSESDSSEFTGSNVVEKDSSSVTDRYVRYNVNEGGVQVGAVWSLVIIFI